MTRSKITRTLNIGYLLIAAGLSYIHIVEVLQHWGSTWQSWIGPILIDGLAFIAKLYDNTTYTPATRKLAHRTVLVVGSLSLGCNIYAGVLTSAYGDSALGVLAVLGFMWGEKLAEKATLSRARTQTTRRRPAAKKTAAKKAPAKKPATKTTPATTRPTLTPVPAVA